MTCIGNSGPLDEPIADAITQNDLVVAGVLSGNRNFEGRVHALVGVILILSKQSAFMLRYAQITWLVRRLLSPMHWPVASIWTWTTNQ